MNENGLMQYTIPLHLHNTFEFTNSYNLKVEDNGGVCIFNDEAEAPRPELSEELRPISNGCRLET